MNNRKKDIVDSTPDFKRLFEEAPGLFLVLDPQLRAVAASNAYLEATLTSREEIIGRHIFNIFPDNPDDPSADSVRNSRASFNRVLQTRVADTIGLQRHDVRRPESEGGGFEVRYWSAVNYPILNADGSLAYIMHRVENVTEFVQLKQQGVEQSQVTEALREQALSLEADLYARSREMAATSQKLKDANEELSRLYEKTRELDTLKTDFFANVSHELRTPLTLILGPVQKLLASPALSEEHRHDLTVIQRNARLLLKNVNDLLDLSKLDAGRMQLEYARLDLVSLARFVASHFETVADEKELHFVVVTPAALPAEVDPVKLQRVLLNLLSNAFKFTPARGKVRFSLRQEKEDAVFAVEDTGPGIPPDMRSTIFERFRQVDRGPTRRHEGTGLGLSIAKEFVTLHGGSIRVTEPAGGGAQFVVNLPVRAPEGTAVKTTGAALEEEGEYPTVAGLLAARRSAGEAEALLPGAPLVLVVEDNPEMNAFINEVLSHEHRVASAFDGADGLAQAIGLRPDLIVTDLMMPEMSGDEMISEIRRHRELDDVPILLLTAKADEALPARLLASGAQDSLTKPFLAEELVARADSLISRKRRAEESLRESEERFRGTFENAAVGIAHIAVDGTFIQVNNRLAELLGYSREELSAVTLQEVTYPQDIETDAHDYERLKRGEIENYAIEKRYVRHDGRLIWGRLTVSFLRDRDGAPLHAISIIEDITDRKAADDALREARDLLEVRVQERTEELRQALNDLRAETEERIRAVEELRKNEQMLMQQSRMAAMADMLLNVSHQWRQPLNVLAANIQRLGIMYEHGAFSAELLYGTVDAAMEIVTKLSHTIDDFHDFLSSDKERESFSVDDVIKRAVALMEEAFKSQGITIEMRGSGGELTGAAGEYGQVLMNLLNNARDALLQHREEERKILLNAEIKDGRSVVTVTDNAGGIDKDVAGKIFDAYFTTKVLGKGTGVGLFLSKMIIEKNMGGRLSFRNVEDGAEFEIEVPISPG